MRILKLLSVTCAGFIFFSACKKETGASTVTLNEMVNPVAAVVKKGDFMSGPYGNVSGMAELFKQDTVYTIKLTNFASSNGPDLHVYLSKEVMPVNYIDLGSLKSTNGNQVYNIPGKPDFSAYKYIAIHCVAFNHLFGSAIIN